MIELIDKNISVKEMSKFLEDLNYYREYLNNLANLMYDDFEDGISEFEEEAIGVVVYEGIPYIKFRGLYTVDYVYFSYDGYIVLKREDDYMIIRLNQPKIVDIVNTILDYYVKNDKVKVVDSL